MCAIAIDPLMMQKIERVIPIDTPLDRDYLDR